MPKRDGEEQWQYMGRMVDLANTILVLARTEPADKVWFYADLAVKLDVPVEDVAVACRTIGFTHEAHSRDTFFFLKSREEKSDDLDWALGTGRFAQ